MRISVPEILQQVADAKPVDRAGVLKKYADNQMLKDVLELNFHPTVEFDLPPGNPPYKVNPQPIGLTDSNLYAEWRRIYLLIKGHPKRPAGIKRLQVENVYIQMLEGVHSDEAELMVALKDKQLAKKYKGLTEKVVREAFPTLLPAIPLEKP